MYVQSLRVGAACCLLHEIIIFILQLPVSIFRIEVVLGFPKLPLGFQQYYPKTKWERNKILMRMPSGSGRRKTLNHPLCCGFIFYGICQIGKLPLLHPKTKTISFPFNYQIIPLQFALQTEQLLLIPPLKVYFFQINQLAHSIN